MKVTVIIAAALMAVAPIAAASSASATTLVKPTRADRNHAIAVYGQICSISEAQTAEEKRFITSFCNPKVKTNPAANRLGYCERTVIRATLVTSTCLRDARHLYLTGI